MSLLANIGSAYLIAGEESGRHGTAHPSIVPYQALPTLDGYLVFGATNNAAFERFCRALGICELLDDVRFKDNASRVAHREELIPILEEKFLTFDTQELADILERASVVNSPINSVAQVFEDAQVIARDMVQEVQHPTVGPIKLTGPAVKYSHTPAKIRSPPPLLGQHSREILINTAGMSEAQVDDLIDRGVVGTYQDS